MFALFIASTGVTHLANVITVWLPYYGFAGLLKAITAAISITTALLIIPLTPKILKLMEKFKGEDNEIVDKVF